MRFINIDEIYVPVRQLEKTLNWYEAIFHAAIAREANGTARVIFPDGAVTLFEAEKVYPYPTNPFGICTYDGKVTYSEFRSKGVVVSDLEIWKGMQTFDCADPDGIPIGIVGWNEKGFENRQFIRVNGYSHVVKNLKRAREWYEGLFRAEVQYDFTYTTKAHGEVHAVSYKNYRLSLVEVPEAPSVWFTPFSINTSNAEEARQYFSDHKVDASEMEDSAGGKRFYITDTDGNKIGIVEGGINVGVWK
ncbi:MAG: glyoxalase family protein [Paenibacillaceae bacterium]|jgi:catechol 2,3-dioxygenase-like lactoylglutathione lyase family enzyme|nr:glyoxalase family protein [Paenibacillaceae bacterium]